MASNRTIRFAKLMVGSLDVETHLTDDDKHRLINDAGIAVTDLWSGDKINTELNDIDASQLTDGTLAPVKLDATGVPGASEDNYVPTYNHATLQFDWEDMAGVVGQDTYQVKWNTGDAAEFLDQKIPDPTGGSGLELLRINAGGTAYELGPALPLPVPVLADATKLVKVNAAGDAFDFATKLEIPAAGDATKLVKVNSAEDGLELSLKIPDIVAGDAGKALRINSAEDGLELITAPAAPNLFINPEHSINQEEYAGAALAVDEQGEDMWQACAASVAWSLVGNVVTVDTGSTAGAICQKNDEIVANDGETVTFSIQTGSVSIFPSGGSETVVTPSTPHTFVLAGTVTYPIRIGKTGETYSQPKLEVGSSKTAYEVPVEPLEALKCFRYYVVYVSGLPVAGVGSASAGGADTVYFNLPLQVPMRSTPTISVYRLSVLGFSENSGQVDYPAIVSISLKQSNILYFRIEDMNPLRDIDEYSLYTVLIGSSGYVRIDARYNKP